MVRAHFGQLLKSFSLPENWRERKGVFEYKETSELLVTIHWSKRNRRATNHRSHLALIPIEKLFTGHGADLAT